MSYIKENAAQTSEAVETANEENVYIANYTPDASKSQHIDLAAMAQSILSGGVMP